MSQLDTALLTVEQASKTWCPEARALQQKAVPQHGLASVNTAPAACNRVSLRDGTDVTVKPSQAAMCLGDGCIYWRWHDRGGRWQRPLAKVPAEWDKVSIADIGGWIGKPDDGRDWQIDEDEGCWYVPAPTLPPQGYCGRAGHPHQADLLEAQMELVRMQLLEHRRAG
ncbi:hypothetical protein [Methylobacterium fujisawaense]|uniref:hypothetical protein n=1 Tax=Methylobacterium fujisawaense TaxID=107400 RepID=UPI0036FB21EE